LRRVSRELEHEGKVFDLPARSFWRGTPDLDCSVVFHGHRAAHPLGPAAGPQTQMAQNIALSWLAGARILELKTVQTNDRLTIPRPCIDATNVVYNVEWSQELRLEESLREYVKGSMLVDVLREVEALGPAPSPGRDQTIFDMSVGYDLEGIRSPQIRAWMEALRDARAHVEALRREIPSDLGRWRDLDFRTALSDQVTLSTFHGCPADEIEAIGRFLLDEMDLHLTVKLNPTLLGRDTVDGLLHDVLGYTEIETRDEDFERDLQWAQALEMVDRLSEAARSRGRTFAVKLTNTLVVRNHRPYFPAGEEVMYLSGQPLHVLTLHLLERFRQQRPDLPISFSAGVDSRNFPDCVALGLVPITVCSDLLRPGGYARLPRYLARLEEKMRTLGVTRIGDYVVGAEGRGEEAVQAAIEPGPLGEALLSALGAERVDLLGALEREGRADLYPRLVETAARLNTGPIVERATGDPRYRAGANRETPRRIGSHLSLFDCINCDKCLPVCPNDANFVYETEPLSADAESFRVGEGKAVAAPGGRFEVRERHQIAVFQDFCNDCGNCDTFCPEEGGPYLEKPRFFGTLDGWHRWRERDGFFLAREGEDVRVWARLRGREYALEIDRAKGRAVFTDGALRLEIDHPHRRILRAEAEPGAPEGHVLDVSAYLATALALDGVLDPSRANPVNCSLAGPAAATGRS
jgi:putative selenate reductase